MAIIATDADIEVDTLSEENQQLRGEAQELRDQLALVQPRGGIMEIQTTSAQLISKLLLIHVHETCIHICICIMCIVSTTGLGRRL